MSKTKRPQEVPQLKSATKHGKSFLNQEMRKRWQPVGCRKRKSSKSSPDPHTSSRQYTGDQRCHDDWEDIARTFSIPRGSIWDVFTDEEADAIRDVKAGQMKLEKELIPNYIHHAWDYDDKTMLAGGTDYLAVGAPGSGKSTLALHTSLRLMEENGEKIVWRASTARSEWLPLAPWARVCLPEGVDVNARLYPRYRPRTVSKSTWKMSFVRSCAIETQSI